MSQAVVPETHFPEYILSRHVGTDDGWGLGNADTKEIEQPAVALKNSQSSETKHQHVKRRENSYKATNLQVQTNILQHKLNACGNVWLPKQQDGARHFGP